MGRSKKNWDHLVDKQGNYGIDIINGIYPGSNGNTIKGNKVPTVKKVKRARKAIAVTKVTKVLLASRALTAR